LTLARPLPNRKCSAKPPQRRKFPSPIRNLTNRAVEDRSSTVPTALSPVVLAVARVRILCLRRRSQFLAVSERVMSAAFANPVLRRLCVWSVSSRRTKSGTHGQKCQHDSMDRSPRPGQREKRVCRAAPTPQPMIRQPMMPAVDRQALCRRHSPSRARKCGSARTC